jgi:hypothetical protein
MLGIYAQGSSALEKVGKSIKEMKRVANKVFVAPVCRQIYVAIWGQGL